MVSHFMGRLSVGLESTNLLLPSAEIVLLHTIIDWHILVFLCIYITVEDCIITSLLFEKIAIELQVKIRWVNFYETSFSLIFQHRFFNHCIICSFLFCWWPYWESTPIFFIDWIRTSYAIKLLFKHFRKKRALDKSSFYCCILLIRCTFSSRETCSESDGTICVLSVVLWSSRVYYLSVYILLLNRNLLHFFVL